MTGCLWPFASIYEFDNLAAMGFLRVIRFETRSCLRCAQNGPSEVEVKSSTNPGLQSLVDHLLIFDSRTNATFSTEQTNGFHDLLHVCFYGK